MVNARWWWEFGGDWVTDLILPPGHGGFPPGQGGGTSPGKNAGKGQGQGWAKGKKGGVTSGEAFTAVSTGVETELTGGWTNPCVMVMLHASGISNTASVTYRIQLSEDGGSTWLAGTNYDFQVTRIFSGAGTIANATDRIGWVQAGGNEDVGAVMYLPFPGDNAVQHALSQHKNQQETGGTQQSGMGAARTSSARQVNAARLYRSDGGALNSGARFTAILLGPT